MHPGWLELSLARTIFHGPKPVQAIEVLLYKINTILYFIFCLIITSSHLALKTVWILISWLLQKPADLDLHCFQEKPADQDPYCLQELIYIWFHTVFESNLFKHSKVLANLFFRTSKFFYGQVHFGFLHALWASRKFYYFHTPDLVVL